MELYKKTEGSFQDILRKTNGGKYVLYSTQDGQLLYAMSVTAESDEQAINKVKQFLEQ